MQVKLRHILSEGGRILVVEEEGSVNLCQRWDAGGKVNTINEACKGEMY